MAFKLIRILSGWYRKAGFDLMKKGSRWDISRNGTYITSAPNFETAKQKADELRLDMWKKGKHPNGR